MDIHLAGMLGADALKLVRTTSIMDSIALDANGNVVRVIN